MFPGQAGDSVHLQRGGGIDLPVRGAFLPPEDVVAAEVEQQRAIDVRYRGEVVGLYQADLLVDGRLVIELKVADALLPIHKAQCLNYLRATGLETGLVINFGRPHLEIRRILA